MKPVALTAAAVAAFGLTVGAALAASGFVDVADNHRASAEITAAHQVGVFQGYGDGTFRPAEKLTRGQAELVIHRMLTWQGTDDDGNFEISRADAAVLAMSGLCGLDPDRIPACAAVGAASEAEVQAAYDRGYDNGFDDGLDAAAPTGSTPTSSTPPPVTAPAEPATAAEKCDAVTVRYTWTKERINGWNLSEGTQKVDGWSTHEPQSHGWIEQGIGTTYTYAWGHYYEADLEDGWFVCTVYSLDVRHFVFRNHEGEIVDLPLPGGERLIGRWLGNWTYKSGRFGPPARSNIFVTSRCWVTRTDPVTGEEYYEQPRRHIDGGAYEEQTNESENPGAWNYTLRRREDPFLSSVIRAAIAGDRPDPDLWPHHDPADCPDGEPVFEP